MKLVPCIIFKSFLNFSNSEPEYSYKLYSYKKVRTRKKYFSFFAPLTAKMMDYLVPTVGGAYI